MAGIDKIIGYDWLARETMVAQALLTFCILCLISQVFPQLFYQDQVINARVIYVLLRKGHFRSSALDLGQASQRELLALPLKALELFSPKQAEEYLRPGRVSYDEHLMLPPAINYLSPEKLAALESSLQKVLDKKIQLYAGVAVKRDPVKDNAKGLWSMIREVIERVSCYMKHLLRCLYEMIFSMSHEALQLSHQKIVSFRSRSVQLRRVALVPFASRLPSLASITGLAIRRVSLMPRKQNIDHFNVHNYSKSFPMFLFNMAETLSADYDGSAGDEWLDDTDALHNYCPMHRHPHGMNRKNSDLEAPNDLITGKCACHYHKH